MWLPEEETYVRHSRHCISDIQNINLTNKETKISRPKTMMQNQVLAPESQVLLRKFQNKTKKETWFRKNAHQFYL